MCRRSGRCWLGVPLTWSRLVACQTSHYALCSLFVRHFQLWLIDSNQYAALSLCGWFSGWFVSFKSSLAQTTRYPAALLSRRRHTAQQITVVLVSAARRRATQCLIFQQESVKTDPHSVKTGYHHFTEVISVLTYNNNDDNDDDNNDNNRETL